MGGLSEGRASPGAPPYVASWDLDKTYLRTEFDTLQDLVRTAFERPHEKRTVPGAAPLLRELAAARPDLRIVLVGPSSLDPAATADLASAGVQLLGPRPYHQVPAYLQHADVVIVPHVVSPFTESLDPIKAYECAAAGRPTVATPVAGFRAMGPPVTTADRDDFAAAVSVALASGSVRPTVGAVPSWQDRTEALAAVMDRIRSGRGR